MGLYCVKLLLENGAGVNKESKFRGETPLYSACDFGGKTELVKILTKSHDVKK